MNVFQKVTLRTLRENRVRTLVTIFGIILSAAMFTAVTTSVSSLQSYVVNLTIERNGDWHGVVYDAQSSQIEELKDDAEVDASTFLQFLGYARLDGIQNNYKPYLFVAGMSENFSEIMPVNLTSGRLPETTTEIILPEHLQFNGGLRHAIGDTLSLAIGNRVVDGYDLTQNTAYIDGEDGVAEELVVHDQRMYTVVGFYERPAFESFSAPGFTALTVASSAEQDRYDVYIKLERPRGIYRFMSEKFPENGTSTNADLLRFIGASNENTFNGVLYGLAAVLITLITVGSISLIYNAFSISISERTQQHGLFSSIGATRRQLMHGVLFEALFLSLIGLPLGILAGIGGIAVTFTLAKDLFATFLFFETDVAMGLVISWEALIVAIVMALATVLVSAYLPARRALRVSPIDAIRQANDIVIDAKKVKTSRLTYQLVGFEGTLASKNFKRNNKKYRATVLSLFLSVVLFISASSFCAYLGKSANSVIQSLDFDIALRLSPLELEQMPFRTLFDDLSKVEGVTQAGYASYSWETVKIPKEWLQKDYVAYIERVTGGSMTDSETIDMGIELYFIDDQTYEEYVTHNRFGNDFALIDSAPKAIALDFIRLYDGQEGRYYTFNALDRDEFDLPFSQVKTIEGYTLWSTDYDEDGTKYVIFRNSEGEEMRLNADQAMEDSILQIGTVTNNRPFMIGGSESGLTLIYPYRAMKQVINRTGDDMEINLYFTAEDHKATYEKMSRALEDRGMVATNLTDYAEHVEADRAMVSVVNIFSYGFIVLISLIAAANVFNTISTNIGLRRREFAMLKSIGMTQKGFTRMMNYECLLYGFKALLYGIPVSVFVTYLIYRSILSGYEISFFIPGYSVAIAVGSVFLVVFSTMIYSMNKIRRDNLIDTLRNENL